MSQDNNINRLPIEILCNVFNLLSFEEQQTATLTCVHWSEILTSERYLKKRRVKIHPDMIADSVNTEALLRYRAFSVEDDKITVHNLKTMRRLLKEQVAEHAEELRLILYDYKWAQFFTPQDKLYFPKLRKLTLSISTFGNRAYDHKQLVAPELREMHLKRMSESIFQLVQLYSEQLEKLSIVYGDLSNGAGIFENRTFENLRSLTMMYWPKLAFNSTLKNMFARLTSLTLNECRDNYSFILQAAINLETLIITGYVMDEKTFSQIDKMIRLKELWLIISIRNLESAGKLSLPLLEKLRILTGTFVPLGNVPRLRKLFIGNNTLMRDETGLSEMQIKPFFQQINQQMETLAFCSMFVNTSFIKQICAMSNLRSLELYSIKMKSNDISKVCHSLNRRGQSIHFVNCVFGREIARIYDESDSNEYDSDDYDEHTEVQYWTAASLEAAEIFFRELISLYPDHMISQRCCQIVDIIEEEYYWEYIDTLDL